MDDGWVRMQAQNLKQAIEGQQYEASIGFAAQEVARALGGTANLGQMTPGAAAVYLVALMLAQLPEQS